MVNTWFFVGSKQIIMLKIWDPIMAEKVSYHANRKEFLFTTWPILIPALSTSELVHRFQQPQFGSSCTSSPRPTHGQFSAQKKMKWVLRITSIGFFKPPSVLVGIVWLLHRKKSPIQHQSSSHNISHDSFFLKSSPNAMFDDFRKIINNIQTA